MPVSANTRGGRNFSLLRPIPVGGRTRSNLVSTTKSKFLFLYRFPVGAAPGSRFRMIEAQNVERVVPPSSTILWPVM